MQPSVCNISDHDSANMSSTMAPPSKAQLEAKQRVSEAEPYAMLCYAPKRHAPVNEADSRN